MYKNYPYRNCSTCAYSMNCPMIDNSAYGYYNNYPMMYRMDDSEEYETDRGEGPEKIAMIKKEPVKHVQPQQKPIQKQAPVKNVQPEQKPIKQVIPQPKQEQIMTPKKEHTDVEINVHPKVEPQYMELTIQPKLQDSKMELDIEPKIHPIMEPSNMELNIEPKMGSIIIEPIKLQLIIEPVMEPTTMQLNIQPIMEPMEPIMPMEMEQPIICPITKHHCTKMKHKSCKTKHKCHSAKKPCYEPEEQEDIEYQFIHPQIMKHQSDKSYSDSHMDWESDMREFMDNE